MNTTSVRKDTDPEPPVHGGGRGGEAPAEAGFFELEAARYAASYDSRGVEGYAQRSRLEVTLRVLGGEPRTVLDVGVGPGHLCGELAIRGWRVTGVDPSPAMLELARARVPSRAVRLLPGSIEALPFEAATFDTVVAIGVLEYVSDVEAALAEVERVLLPGGRAVLGVPNTRAPYAVWRGRIVYPLARLAKRVVRLPRPPRPRGRRVDVPVLERLLPEAGLLLRAVDRASPLVFPTPLETLFPRLTIAVGKRVERSSPRVLRLFATQDIVTASKPA
jgi:SAM-dependent methyltransferase